MTINVKKHLAKAVILLAALSGSTYAFADCPAGTTLAPLASDIANGTKNTTICVDVLNKLTSNHFVYDIDTPVTKDGIPATAGGTPLAFKHMWLMSSANLAFMKKNLSGVDTVDSTTGIARFSIIGVIHGSALKWALSDAWWKSQVDDDGNQLYPNGNPNKAWFAKLQALQAQGMDVRLEVCGVTLEGAGLTRDDVYSDPTTGWRIKVNQGAFGRMSTLHREGYAIVSEGWEDNDRQHHDLIK
jgi:intracellular sulfur oxidation DsrE/DsrF family protein